MKSRVMGLGEKQKGMTRKAMIFSHSVEIKMKSGY